MRDVKRVSAVVLVAMALGAWFGLSGGAALRPAEGPRVVAPAPTVPLEVCWLETGGTTVAAGFAAGGPTSLSQWEVTSSALLVRHPKGDVLIDSGISPNAAAEAAELSAWKHFVFGQTAGRNEPRGSLTSMLAALKAEPTAVILSHAHPDHAGGLGALPANVGVWLAKPEADLVNGELAAPRGVVVPSQARALQRRLRPIDFAAVPYAVYEAQFDVFGDGSVVVVPTFGHTPGSVATFVNLSATKRLLYAGDLINVGESLERRVGKSWLMRRLTDEDDAQTEAQVQRLLQLHDQDPGLTILPAHDRPAYVAFFGADPLKTGAPPCIGEPSLGQPVTDLSVAPK